jgi:hypothetical protein
MSNERQEVFSRERIEDYLREEFGPDISVRQVSRLGARDSDVKAFGYGQPLLIRAVRDGREQKLVLHTLRGDPFDHQYPADRAGELCLAHHTFNELPRHIRSLALGAVTERGECVSIRRPQEFFLLTEFAEGKAYAQDLSRIAATNRLEDKDEARAVALAEYLADIHKAKSKAPDIYQRRVRELVGDGEGIMGMLDTFPGDTPDVGAEKLQEIERLCVSWRWAIRSRTHRLSQIHGDFHPWNVLFNEGGELTLLDRSRGAWGEPADDVVAMDINYVFFSLRAHGCLVGPFEDLHRRFWEVYLSRTRDSEILAVAPLFYVWRALVLAHPWWYPDLTQRTRAALLRFVMAMLRPGRFDPAAVNEYLRP